MTALAAPPLHEPASVPLAADSSTLFIAEEITPLFYTAAYAQLPANARCRYNQLHALYFNEQVAFFEQAMLTPTLQALLRLPLPVELAAAVTDFHAEEQRHTASFRALNRTVAPHLYSTRQPHYFISVHPLTQRVLSFVASHPQHFPFLLWLALLQEERSLFYSQWCLRAVPQLDPRFIALHRQHLADEVGHVRWDEALLDWLWPRVPPRVRRLNGHLLSWMVHEFFLLPKRGGRRVIEQLCREFPDLPAPEIRRALDGLQDCAAFRRTLYHREMIPRTLARLSQEPAFASLGRVLIG